MDKEKMIKLVEALASVGYDIVFFERRQGEVAYYTNANTPYPRVYTHAIDLKIIPNNES